MTAPFLFQFGTDAIAVLIWAGVNLGMASDYRPTAARSRRKALPQRQTKINPVRQARADQEVFERGDGQPALNGRQPALLKKIVGRPNGAPEDDAATRQERQRIPPQCVGEVEAGTGLETARAAAEPTRDTGQSLQAAQRQWQVPLDGKASDGEQAKEPGEYPGRRNGGRDLSGPSNDRRRVHRFSPRRTGGAEGCAFFDSSRMPMLLSNAQSIRAHNS